MPVPVPSPPRDAGPTSRGLVSTLAQTLKGIKSFLDPIRLARVPAADLPVGSSELEGHLAFDSSAKKVVVHDGTGWAPLKSGGDDGSLAEHIASTQAHPASSVTYDPASGSSKWADNSAFSPNRVAQAIDLIISVLAGTNAASKLGAYQPNPYNSGNTIQSVLNALNNSKVEKSSLSAYGYFAGEFFGSNLVGTVPITSEGIYGYTVATQLQELASQKSKRAELAASTGTGLIGGSAKSGMPYFNLDAGTAKQQLEQLLSFLNAVRPDMVPPTCLLGAGVLPSNPFGAPEGVWYSKDSEGWVHIYGTIYNSTSEDQSFSIAVPEQVRPPRRLTSIAFERTSAGDFTGGLNAVRIVPGINGASSILTIDLLPSEKSVDFSVTPYRAVQ